MNTVCGLSDRCLLTVLKKVLVMLGLFGAIELGQAQIILTATGGVGETLHINVTAGDVFTKTGSTGISDFLGVAFDGFYNNTVADISEAKNEPTTLGLNGLVGSPSVFSGSMAQNDLTLDDLYIGFRTSAFTSIPVGASVTLNPGHRETGGVMSLNYTTINPGGDAFLIDLFGNKISGNVTWSSVPEPSTYGMVGGIVCVLAAGFRWRFGVARESNESS